jgi:hypothetical protein
VAGDPVAEVTLAAHSVRRDPKKADEVGETELAGSVLVRHAGVATEIAYAGRERHLDEPDLRRVRDSQYWPRIGTIVPGQRQRSQVPQNARQHAAVVFAYKKGTVKAPLSATWAVTLPVGDEPFSGSQPDEGSVTLTLHGHFFVDAGRMRAEFAAEPGEAALCDERAVQQEWNRLLRNRGSFPLVLRALADFQKQCAPPPPLLRQLTAQLCAVRRAVHG